MGISIISNNCAGVRMMQDLKLRYDTPTIALQIMPEEFTKFCVNLDYYLSLDITEYTEFSDEHKEYLANMYGDMITFPVGLCGDIAICFQHETSFEVAREKWNRRKTRVDKVIFFFVLEYERYRDCAVEFIAANLPNSYVFTNGFEVDGSIRYEVPKGKNFLEKDRHGQWFFEGGLKRSTWLN